MKTLKEKLEIIARHADGSPFEYIEPKLDVPRWWKLTADQLKRFSLEEIEKRFDFRDIEDNTVSAITLIENYQAALEDLYRDARRHNLASGCYATPESDKSKLLLQSLINNFVTMLAHAHDQAYSEGWSGCLDYIVAFSKAHPRREP